MNSRFTLYWFKLCEKRQQCIQELAILASDGCNSLNSQQAAHKEQKLSDGDVTLPHLLQIHLLPVDTFEELMLLHLQGSVCETDTQ